MRTLIHLSDLHFDRIWTHLIAPLIDTVTDLNPDLIAVSGDLTQRARMKQFQSARAFLDALPAPKVIVPGNHDIPFYNFFKRFQGLRAYRRHITDDLEPFYTDADVAVLGINTARSLTFKNGRINSEQLLRIQERFTGLADSVIKILVSHHPFDLPESYSETALVGRAAMARGLLSDCKIDLLLAGHFHSSVAAPAPFQHVTNGYSSLIVQAGSAISTRTKGNPNAFNVIQTAPAEISVERFEWRSERNAFVGVAIDRFRRAADGWKKFPRS